jgi:hypothetical protein
VDQTPTAACTEIGYRRCSPVSAQLVGLSD